MQQSSLSDREQITQLRRRGHSRKEIATELDLPLVAVNAAIKTTICEMRDASALLIEEAYHNQDDRLNWLWLQVSGFIAKMTAFDEAPIRTALLIMERQARLHGIDRGAPQKVNSGQSHNKALDDWMDTADPAELIEEAEVYGIRLPATFELPAHTERRGPPEGNLEQCPTLGDAPGSEVGF